MAALPFLDHRLREQKIRALAHPRRDVDDAGGADESIDRDVVRGVVGIILARDPMNRRIEVRPGVLPAADVVPVPGRAARVVARDLLERKRLRGRELRRQPDDRRRGLEGHREVDDADAAANDRIGEGGECLCVGGHRSLALVVDGRIIARIDDADYIESAGCGALYGMQQLTRQEQHVAPPHDGLGVARSTPPLRRSRRSVLLRTGADEVLPWIAECCR